MSIADIVSPDSVKADGIQHCRRSPAIAGASPRLAATVSLLNNPSRWKACRDLVDRQGQLMRLPPNLEFS